MSGRHFGLNAVFLTPNMGGLDTFVRGLVPALVRAAPRHRFTVFCSAAGREHLAAQDWAGGVTLASHPLLGLPGLKAVSEMTLLGVLARRHRVDLLDSIAMTGPLVGVPHVATVPDVIWMTEDDDTAQATYRLWRRIVPPIARRARRVITISEAAKADIVARLGIDPARVDVTYPGFGLVPGPVPTPDAELRARLGLGPGPVVLNVSTKKRHKNLARLVEAMPAVRERVPGAQLVIPGNPTPHEQELRALGARLDVEAHFPPFVPREDLEGLYAAAACFAFPSTSEGFGLPVLEAMVRGVPVACSTAGPLPEVAGGAARYFNPFSVEAIADAVSGLLLDPGDLAATARAHAAAFTWERCAEQTLESFERALA